MNPRKISAALIDYFAAAEKGDLIRVVPLFDAFGIAPLDVARLVVSVSLQKPCDVNTFGGFEGTAYFRLPLPVSLDPEHFEKLTDEFYSFFDNPGLAQIFRGNDAAGVFFAHVSVSDMPEPEIDEAGFVFEVNLKIAGQLISTAIS